MTTPDLTTAIRALSEREAELVAEFVGGMALAHDEAGSGRMAAVWRALGCQVVDEAERQRQVLAALEDGPPDG